MLLLLQALRSRTVCKLSMRTYSTEYLNTFCWRTHTCGELRSAHVGEKVTLCGWVEFRRPKKFLVLRDWHGHVQLLLKTGNSKIFALESVVKAEGVVHPRPERDINPEMETGQIEVHVEKIELLNPCLRLPFPMQDFKHKNEDTRMRYRYLDIRTQNLQQNLRVRSKLVSSMRKFLIQIHGFVEVETPTLFRPTPGGAREFLVPSSAERGLFYSLPQSPQQFKQLLMVGGVDRYFQVARCYRDEGAKPDRQPEFSQLDIEMSFVSAEDVMSITENMIKSCWPSDLGDEWFLKMTFKDSIDKYGTDKPDIRFQLTLDDVTGTLENLGVINDPDTASSLLISEDYSKFLTQTLVEEVYRANQMYFAKNSVPNSIFLSKNGTPNIICGENIPDSVMHEISTKLKMQENDLAWIAWGSNFNVKSLLGKARLLLADALEEAGMTLRSENEHKFLWVNDFPLFEYDSEQKLQSVHHPFTAPHPEDIHLLETEPEKVRSLSYDLVLNGNEVAGGSIRIHNSSFQRKILDELLKIDSTQLEHLLQALESGAPPHGGIAVGLDRLIAVLCNANTIRDVIAFPKSSIGRDLMCGAPCEADQELLQHYFRDKDS